MGSASSRRRSGDSRGRWASGARASSEAATHTLVVARTEDAISHEATELNARYWLTAARTEANRDAAVMYAEQAMNAWRNLAYASFSEADVVALDGVWQRAHSTAELLELLRGARAAAARAAAKDAPIPVAPPLMMFMPVRRCEQANHQEQLRAVADLDGTWDGAAEKARDRDARLPEWAKRNPVVRIACVAITELPVARPAEDPWRRG